MMVFGEMKNNGSLFSYVPFMTESFVFLQEPARLLLDDGQMPLYVRSIQERAQQLASLSEGKPAAPQVKFAYEHS